MNRPFNYRGRVVAGVIQRCKDNCPDDACTQHRWAYSIELPAGASGKRRQRTKSGFPTGKAAMEARADLAKQHRDGTLPADDKKTVGEWMDEWLNGKVARGEIRDTTERGYRDNIRLYIKPKLGHIKLRDLRGIDLTRFYEEIARERAEEHAAAVARNAEYAAEAARINAERRARGLVRPVRTKHVQVPRLLSPASINRVHVCVSGALAAAVPDLVPRSVAQDAKLPKVEKKKVRPPVPERMGEFLDEVAGHRLYPLLTVAGYTGLRRGELVGLQWGDIDMATGRLVVNRQIVSVAYKLVEREAKSESGQERVVYLDEVTRGVLVAWAATQLTEKEMWGSAYQDDGRGWVFTREDGKLLHPSRVSRVVAQLLRRHGLDNTLHSMRHFWAAALISSGADISAVSKAMGHASISITSDIYGSLFEKAHADMATKAAALIPRRTAA